MRKNLSFDYIIVGSGPAGCVLANRLSANKSLSILLIEAGGSDKRLIIRMPAAFAMAARHKDLDWAFLTEPEKYLCGRRIIEHRGKVLGGSSSINGMVANRGNQMDYDGWAREGLSDWSFESCLPHFKNLESFQMGCNVWRGGNGPQSIEVSKVTQQLSEAYLSAGKEAGHNFSDDQNGEHQEGFHITQTLTKQGRRASAADSYLKPILHRDNLFIETNCFVHAVKFSGKRAVKVKAEKNGEIINFEAHREIILCAGAINTPKILMLSGVGDKSHLANHDIETLVDLPSVGKNLENHAIAPIIYGTPPGISLSEKLNGWKKYKVGLKWLLFKNGIGASTICEVGSFFKSSNDIKCPDLQHEFYPLSSLIQGEKSNFGGGFMFSMGLMRPKSKGLIRLKSANPRDKPEIRYNFLSSNYDIKILTQGLRKTREIAQQKAFENLKTNEITPGASVISDQEVHSWLKNSASTEYHPSSSCRMGIDDNSVTNQVGLVHNTEALRIVDASIMRSNVTANLNVPVLMIAEKISADLS